VNALRQFLEILLKPDNIPIAGMLVLVFFFTWVRFARPSSRPAGGGGRERDPEGDEE